ALREEDYYIGRLWKILQADPFYKKTTTLIVTTDHGRDNIPDPHQWWDHGECLRHGDHHLCSGCQQSFAVFVGPGIRSREISTPYSHADLAPTIARIFGLSMPDGTGKPMAQVLH